VTEPAFIRRRSFDLIEQGEEAFYKWRAACVEEGRAAGCKHMRLSWLSPTGSSARAYVIEGWLERPESEGEPRFAETPA
jgi:hypothetical protein